MDPDEPAPPIPDEADRMLIAPQGPIDGRIQVPPSKSLTIRALAAAALAGGRSALRDPLFSDDTLLMARALQALGIEVQRGDTSMLVEGRAGTLPARGASLDLGNAGTPLRLLTAICCLGRGRFLLDGSARMRQRPLTHLIEALGSMGVLVTSVDGNGCPPVEILADGYPGGPVRLAASVSSQFVSALLMAAPHGAADLHLEVTGEIVSAPYIDLTLQVMAAFGARVEREGYRRFRVAAGTGYEARIYPIEADASSASYFFAAAAVTGGRVTVTGIPLDSRQGDLRFLDLIEAMGCRVQRSAGGLVVEGGTLAGIDADLGDCPDVAPTLAAVALFAEGPTTMRRIAHLRVKETDRIETTAACVRALGATAEAGPDSLTVIPPPSGRRGLAGAAIDPKDDHRIAMAFAVAGLGIGGVRILDPGCVGKSYPDFFDRLATLTGS